MWSLQAREGDHGVGGDQAAVAGRQRAAGDRLRHRRPFEADVRAVQQTGDRLAGDRSEQVQRPRLRRHDHELRPGGQFVRGEQRQLIERQRPPGVAGQR